MAYLWNKSYTKMELLRRVGDIRQLAAVEACELADGNERGVRMVRLRSAGGLDFTVLPDRGMALGNLSFQGLPLPFQNSVGWAHPSYSESTGMGFLRTFPGGFSVPCGLTQVGSPCTEGGEELGLHGRVASLAARNLAWDGEWQGDDYLLWVSAQVRETRFFGENITLTRRVSTRLGEPRLWIEDRVRNEGFSPSPHMFLQHFNLGFPLVDAGARLEIGKHTTEARDEAARRGIDMHAEFGAPEPGYEEQVFYHDLRPDESGQVAVRLANPDFDGGRGLSLTLRYPRAEYPVLVEWKMMGEGAYVVGLEPANCHVEGRCAERERGTLQVLAPQEERVYHIEVMLA